MLNDDPLFVVNPKRPCPACKNERHARRNCQPCQGTGHKPVDICGLWNPQPGFLVCGGPSINKIPFQRLSERGIASLAVNNVAGHVPVTAWCYGDPQNKFHHGIHLDPKCIIFAPLGKLKKHIRARLPDGTFRTLDFLERDCPGTFGFSRKAIFDAETFLQTEHAQWGRGGNQPEDDSPFRCIDSMLLGIRLLHYLGCPRVYMLGVDFEMTDNAQYAFGQQCGVRNGRYGKQDAMLKELRPVFEKNGFFLYNCNPDSKCTAFDYVPFDKAFEDCKGAVPKEPFDLKEWYNKGIAEEQSLKFPGLMKLDELRSIQGGHQTTSST